MPDWIAATLLVFGLMLGAILVALALAATAAAYGVGMAIGLLAVFFLVATPIFFYFTLGR